MSATLTTPLSHRPERPRSAPVTHRVRSHRSGSHRWWLLAGALLLPAGVGVLAWRPHLLPFVVAAPVAAAVLVGAVTVVMRRPGLGVVGAVLVFALSGELQLRLGSAVGPAKDAVLAVLVVATAWGLVRRGVPRGLHLLAVPAAAFGVLALLYLADPAGGHGVSWLFGTRLLLSALLLGAVGVLLAARGPDVTRPLVTTLAVLVPFEAALAWWQRSLGWEELVYGWGYQLGAQVRFGTAGGLRTSGTFQDPFQLAGLAVLAFVVGLFLARGRVRVLICASAVAALLAADVRTAVLQTGLVLVIWAVSRGWWRQAALVAAAGAAAAALVLVTITSSVVPGGPERPLLLTLNGRFIAWSNAVSSVDSVLVGNGVGDRGTGSTRLTAAAADAPGTTTPPHPTRSTPGTTRSSTPPTPRSSPTSVWSAWSRSSWRSRPSPSCSCGARTEPGRGRPPPGRLSPSWPQRRRTGSGAPRSRASAPGT
ncbi:hypothetical protein [Litorihabitans aurantiacus]|uniref:Uncharacterized protein n=1 Tax=Litorihabitans aurantiacus TaxID=1930061 RepID=A0AA38CTF3_9MICO|nr:hypothetical protein [Litorihabitans aurantiacus]GMA31842.1 hypothetical protein GCM10025875_18340 [Litorihabitans aurantiacus]